MINDMGVDPNDWFDPKPHPHDSMPLAKDQSLKYDNKYASKEKMLELESTNPRPEEDVADWFTDKPDESDEIEKEKTIHHKAYEIATSKYNPFSVGGSENISELGGSENRI